MLSPLTALLQEQEKKDREDRRLREEREAAEKEAKREELEREEALKTAQREKEHEVLAARRKLRCPKCNTNGGSGSFDEHVKVSLWPHCFFFFTLTRFTLAKSFRICVAMCSC